MKQVIIQAFCDGSHDDPVPSTRERTIQIDDTKKVLVDVCDSCDQMFSLMLSFMERGAVVDAKGKPARKVSDGPIAKQPHSKKGRKQRERTPPIAKTTGRDPNNNYITVCPVCGMASVTRSALGQHMTTKHNKRFGDFDDAAMERALERFLAMQHEPVPESVPA